MKGMFRGSYVAIITPFKRDGKVDRKALAKFVSWQMEQGTEGILCCATTGEGITLSAQEKQIVATICLEVTAKKIPVLVGTGLPSTKDTVQLTEKMGKLGVSGCLVVTPYYNKPSARGCIAHFTEVATVGLPVIAYHNPSRTGGKLGPEVFAAIGNILGIAALKDSSGDIGFIKQLCQLSSVPILSGDDDLTFETLKAGGVGAISVIGNAFPKQWKEMIHLALQGKWEEAKRIHDRYLQLCKAIFLESNPQCIKWLCSWFGLTSPNLRLPLLEPQEETQKKIKKAVLRMALLQYQSQDVVSKTA